MRPGDVNRPRRTLVSSTDWLEGIGLHTGAPSAVRVHPSQPGTGLVFQDSQTGALLPATALQVTDTTRCTILGSGAMTLQTVEHLLSALSGLGVDDARIEVRGPELPAADGSAVTYVDLLQAAGLNEQFGDDRSQPIVIENPIFVPGSTDSVMTVLPSETFSVTVVLDYPKYPFIGTQAATYREGTDEYRSQIAPARTFGFLHELEWLRAHGLALGANEDNAVALADDRYLTPLRFSNELARHKILDIIGDLALVGRPIQGHVLAYKPSHTLNVQFAVKLKQEVIGP